MATGVCRSRQSTAKQFDRTSPDSEAVIRLSCNGDMTDCGQARNIVSPSVCRCTARGPMTDSIDSRAKHREHIQTRTEYVRGKRGPVSFVWGNHVVKPRQRVPGAAGLWSPPPAGDAGLLVEASAGDGIVIDGRTVDGAAKLAVGPDHPASIAYFSNGSEGVI